MHLVCACYALVRLTSSWIVEPGFGTSKGGFTLMRGLCKRELLHLSGYAAVI